MTVISKFSNGKVHNSKSIKQDLYEHILATGPITLYDILGWMGQQFSLDTASQVATFQSLWREGFVEHYELNDYSLGYVVTLK